MSIARVKEWDERHIRITVWVSLAVSLFLYVFPIYITPSSVGIYFRALIFAAQTESAALQIGMWIAPSVIFFVFTIAAIFLRKRKWDIALLLPIFCTFGIFDAISVETVSMLSRMNGFSSAAIILPMARAILEFLCCVLICAYLIALYRKPREPRKRKPTKSERIAELERQVAELTKEKDAE